MMPVGEGGGIGGAVERFGLAADGDFVNAGGAHRAGQEVAADGAAEAVALQSEALAVDRSVLLLGVMGGPLSVTARLVCTKDKNLPVVVTAHSAS